jgi:hypothetical protein
MTTGSAAFTAGSFPRATRSVLSTTQASPPRPELLLEVP